MRRPALHGLLAFALACGGAPVTTHSSVDSSRTYLAVVVEPVRGTHGGAPTDALGNLLAGVALQSVNGEALVWSGTEIQVLHPERQDWSATTAVPLLLAAGISPARTVALRARVESGQAASQQEVQGANGSALGASAELHWRATVEILEPSTGQLLVETSSEARSDPFARGGAEAAAAQPADVLQRAAAEALGRLSGQWVPARTPHGPFLKTWTVVPPPAVPLGQGLDAEVQRLALLQTSNPGLEESEAAQLARLPAGVYVREAPLGFRLRSGDLVISIHGMPATASALARCRFSTSPTELEVRAPDGRLRHVNFP